MGLFTFRLQKQVGEGMSQFSLPLYQLIVIRVVTFLSIWKALILFGARLWNSYNYQEQGRPVYVKHDA